MVPQSLRKETMEEIHNGHQARARGRNAAAGEHELQYGGQESHTT